MDYFLPVRVLASIHTHLGLRTTCVFLWEPDINDWTLFAGKPANPGYKNDLEAYTPSGCMYKFLNPGQSESEKMLTLLGKSLESRMLSSRPVPFFHLSPPALPLKVIAEAVSRRFRDSKAPFATLTVLDADSYVRRLSSDFPLMNEKCLRKDVLRSLASLHEPAGGLYLSINQDVIALTCSSAPTDTELLQIQLNKSLRRFITSAVDLELAIRTSSLFESPETKPMEDFLLSSGTAVS